MTDSEKSEAHVPDPDKATRQANSPNCKNAAEPSVSDPNKAAAHYFLSELRTRITTQPLPYQHGDEDRALTSLWEVFGRAREAMKKYPGCSEFADKVTAMLNLQLRPVTAKWHRAKIEGRLQSRDGADEFRGDLARVQEDLGEFAKTLHTMAYGGDEHIDKPAPDVVCCKKLDKYLKPLCFGIGASDFINNQTVAAINCAEAKAVHDRRAHYGIDTASGTDAIGLALSGGGIRSATFCLGVVQVLAKRGLFKDIDFLSTVSGGGYVGCFITTRLGGDATQEEIAGPDGPDPGAVRYLRRHAKYLAALDLKQAWIMATSTLAGMLLNWTVPFSVIFLVAALAGGARWLGMPSPPWPYLVALAAALSFLALLAYGWKLPDGRSAAAPAAWSLGLGLAFTALFAVLWLVRFGLVSIDNHLLSSSLVAALVTASPAIMRFVPIVKNPTVRKVALQVLLWLAVVVVPLGAITLAYFLAHVAKDHDWIIPLLFAAAMLCGAFAFWRLNINFTGPHRLYRDQLARTFVQADEDKDDPVALSAINRSTIDRSGKAPYHLINTTLNVPSSTKVALRERKSDFFLFSREYCGAPAIGYFNTNRWRTNADPPDLATAMAISGAAASSYMGLGTMPTMTALLTFLNVRLGFWIKHPAPDKPTKDQYPGFLCLLHEMFGFSMSEKDPWLNLSDGGHIENLGIYELLRRRCKLIISVDGESDPTYTFQGLMTLVRHAQIDFGARIEVNLSDIRPDPKTNYSQAHAALCTVHYPDGSLGFIIYMKLSVTGNESELIRRYRVNHSDFPHQTTLDQFFDEEQFEAYRQLGAHVANGLFLPALMNDREIKSVPEWFRQLVKNLLPRPIAGYDPPPDVTSAPPPAPA